MGHNCIRDPWTSFVAPDPWSSAKVKCHPTVNDESVNLLEAQDAKRC